MTNQLPPPSKEDLRIGLSINSEFTDQVAGQTAVYTRSGHCVPPEYVNLVLVALVEMGFLEVTEQ